MWPVARTGETFPQGHAPWGRLACGFDALLGPSEPAACPRCHPCPWPGLSVGTSAAAASQSVQARAPLASGRPRPPACPVPFRRPQHDGTWRRERPSGPGARARGGPPQPGPAVAEGGAYAGSAHRKDPLFGSQRQVWPVDASLIKTWTGQRAKACGQVPEGEARDRSLHLTGRPPPHDAIASATSPQPAQKHKQRTRTRRLPTSNERVRVTHYRRSVPSTERRKGGPAAPRRHRECLVTGITSPSSCARFARVSTFHPLSQNGQRGESTGNPLPASTA
jgi:hypothetical protein